MPDSPPTLDTAPQHTWLIESGLAGVPVPELLERFCKRLVAADIPVARSFLSFATLHPLRWATGFVWQQGKAVESLDAEHGSETGAAWLSSPIRHMLDSGNRRLRRPLAGAGARLDFPLLAELSEQGLTDWLALFQSFAWPVKHSEIAELGVVFSFATDRPGGWAERDIDALEELSGTLALAVRASGAYDITHALLSAYLGRDAAERVIVGQTRRGSVERSAAIILDADLRGFTDFADSAAPEEVTRRLNGYFDCIGAPVKEAGGEILKFLGDGLLAVFLAGAERDMAKVAEAALAAAQEILARVEALNHSEQAAGNATLALDIALHAGEVTYGNVGTAERLDFTVIGPAVNEVSRLEGLCKELGRQLLVSDSFLRAAPTLAGRLRSLGRYRLRGVSEEREVYGLEEDARPKALGALRLRHRARVGFHEVGSEGVLGLVALANHLQKAAGEHAERLGLGMERMAAGGLAWVLSRQRICIRRWPGWGENLTIETWPSLVSGPLFHREFRVLDGAGQEAALATSAWALFDLASRKSLAAPDWIAASLELDPTRAVTFEGRTVPALREAAWKRSVQPRWSDLDINRHVNNAQLLGWCLEALPRELLAAGRLSEIDAQFRSECNLDDSVSSRAGEIEPGLCLHSLIRAADGKELLRARSRWRT